MPSGRRSPGPSWAVVRARQLEWLTLAARASIVLVLGLLLAQAAVVQALLIKNLLALAPPLIFLAAERLEARGPSRRFPYGLHRAAILAYLLNAVALLGLAGFLLIKSAVGLASMHAPALGAIEPGHVARWDGWPLFPALAYAATPPLLLGRRRTALALALHDKSLHADSMMGRAEWRSSAAAIVGLLLVGCGFWWGDYAATLAIALLILQHGATNAWRAGADLLDQVPHRLGDGAPDPVGERVRRRLLSLDWVAAARVRLREHGRLLVGDVVVQPRDAQALDERVAAATAVVRAMDWRLADVVVTVAAPNPGITRS